MSTAPDSISHFPLVIHLNVSSPVRFHLSLSPLRTFFFLHSPSPPHFVYLLSLPWLPSFFFRSLTPNDFHVLTCRPTSICFLAIRISIFAFLSQFFLLLAPEKKNSNQYRLKFVRSVKPFNRFDFVSLDFPN